MRRGAGDDMLAFDLQNVVGISIDSDGYPQAQHNEDGEQGGPPLPILGPLGFISVPLEPEMDSQSNTEPVAAKSCVALRLTQGSRGYSLPLYDPREIAFIPNLVAGDRIWHGAKGTFVRHMADGTIATATTTAGGPPKEDNGDAAQAVVSMVAPDGHTDFGPWGRQVFDQMSWRMTHAGGARVAFGAISGLPGPMGGSQSFARIEAKIIELNGQAVSIGPGGSPHQPVAWAMPLVTILQNMVTTMEAMVVAMGTITTVSPGAAAASSLAPVIAQLQAQIATALETISSTVALG